MLINTYKELYLLRDQPDTGSCRANANQMNLQVCQVRQLCDITYTVHMYLVLLLTLLYKTSKRCVVLYIPLHILIRPKSGTSTCMHQNLVVARNVTSHTRVRRYGAHVPCAVMFNSPNVVPKCISSRF